MSFSTNIKNQALAQKLPGLSASFKEMISAIQDGIAEFQKVSDELVDDFEGTDFELRSAGLKMIKGLRECAAALDAAQPSVKNGLGGFELGVAEVVVLLHREDKKPQN